MNTEELENIEENAYLRGKEAGYELRDKEYAETVEGVASKAREELKKEIRAYLTEFRKHDEYGNKLFLIDHFMRWLKKQ